MQRSISRSIPGVLVVILVGLLAGTSSVRALVCSEGPPICNAAPGDKVCSTDSTKQCHTNGECSPGTCNAAVLGIGGTVTANPNAINSVVLTGATNVTLSVSSTPGSVVTFRAVPTNPSLDAQATVLATDSLLGTCTVPVSFKIRTAGAAINETVCPSLGLFALDALNSPVSPAGTSACSSHLATCADFPPIGYEYLSDTRIVTVRSPIVGSVQMQLTKTGTFDGRLRFIFSRSIDSGASYSKEVDITTSVSEGSTRVRGTAQWSDVRLAVAVESDAVPTVGEWGMILLVLLMLSASTVLLTRRRFALAGSGPAGHVAAGPLFVPRIYARALAGTLSVTLAALAASSLLKLDPTTTDLVGSLAAAGILAYMVHLWVVRARESSKE